MVDNLSMYLNNPKDPLMGSPDLAKELMKKLAMISTGFDYDTVVLASANMVINALRQKHTSRRDAEASFDALSGKSKSVLLEHYDSVTGKRRNIFPHTQNIDVPGSSRI